MVSWESPQRVDYELVHSLPVRDFFVSRIQKEEGVEEVRAHMAGHNNNNIYLYSAISS